MKRVGIMVPATGLLGALAACSTMGAPEGRGATAQGGPEAPAAAQAAVLREVFRSNASALKSGAHSYCVSTGSDRESNNTDPAVLAELRENPKVKPASGCEIGSGGNGVIDRETRRPSLSFNVNTAACASGTDCLIYGGYYEGNMSSQTNRYRARLMNGIWNVTVDELGPVS